MRKRLKPIRILDFDCESRPLGWIGSDYVHSEITVIAWCWWGEKPEVRALSKDDRSRRSMLRAFRKVYDEAGLVVGHYIRSFDLPLVNAMLAELGEQPLSQKLSQDTKNDLLKFHGVSKSQKNLAEMVGVDEEKLDMTVADWRAANRLTTKGTERAVERAVKDVLQNMAMRDALVERGLLGPPRVWRP